MALLIRSIIVCVLMLDFLSLCWVIFSSAVSNLNPSIFASWLHFILHSFIFEHIPTISSELILCEHFHSRSSWWPNNYPILSFITFIVSDPIKLYGSSILSVSSSFTLLTLPLIDINDFNHWYRALFNLFWPMEEFSKSADHA